MAAPLPAKAPSRKGSRGGGSLLAARSHARRVLNGGQRRPPTAGAKPTMELALPPLRISHRHGGLAQGGVDRAGVDAQMYSHRRKGQPGGIEALCLPDVGRLEFPPPPGDAGSVQVATDGAPADLELRCEFVDATAVDIAPDQLSHLVGLQSPEDPLRGSKERHLGTASGRSRGSPGDVLPGQSGSSNVPLPPLPWYLSQRSP